MKSIKIQKNSLYGKIGNDIWNDILSKEKENKQNCLHDQCTDCHGTGKKENGETCIHYISCSCPKCTPSL